MKGPHCGLFFRRDVPSFQLSFNRGTGNIQNIRILILATERFPTHRDQKCTSNLIGHKISATH